MIITANLNVGDKAYADFTKYRRIDVREGTVIKKSTTGVIQVDFGTSLPFSFMANGSQRGGGYYDKAQLIDKESFDRRHVDMMTQRRALKAGEAVKAAANIAATVDNKVRLIEALKIALADVEAI